MKPITIVIADDHKLVREAWAFILSCDDRFKVLAECENAESAIEQVKELRPDVVIMDVNLPGMNGIEAVPSVRKFSPVSKILGVSCHTFPDIAKKMIYAGASGYVTKNSSKDEMFHAIFELMKGNRYICKEIKSLIDERINGVDDPKIRMSSLSTREIEIISAVRDGFTSKEIAEQLRLASKTVEIHRYKILKKLKLRNTAELVDFFNKNQSEF
jgi:two-component system invasion response regulator UvrY